MKKILRYLIILLITVITICGIALSIAVFKPQTYEGLINHFVYKSSGYRYSTGEIDIQLGEMKVDISDFKLINSDYKNNTSETDSAETNVGELMRFQSALLQLDAKKLWNHQLPYWSAQINNTHLTVIENESGELNWQTNAQSGSTQDQENDSFSFRELLSFLSVEFNQFLIEKRSPDANQDLDIQQLSLQRIDESTIHLAGNGTYDKQLISLSGDVVIVDISPDEQVVEYNMKADGLDVHLESSGIINPKQFNKSKFSLSGESTNFNKLETYLKTTFPDVSPIKLSTELSLTENTYEASAIHLQLGENTITGTVKVNSQNNSIDAVINSDLIDLSPFIETTSTEKGDSVQSDLNTSPSSQIDQAIDWTWMDGLDTQISLRVEKVMLNEHQFNLVEMSGKLSQTQFLLDGLELTYQHDTQVSQPISISGSVSPLGKVTTGEDIDLAMVLTEGSSHLEINGQVNINGLNNQDFEYSLKADQLDILSTLIETDLKPFTPLSLTGNVVTTDTNAQIKDLNITSQNSDVSGELAVNWDKENDHSISQIKGKIHSDQLDLNPFFDETSSEKTSVDKTDPSSSEEETKIFSDVAINWDWLNEIDTEITLDIGKLFLLDSTINQLHSEINAGNGVMQLEPFQANFADGKVIGQLHLQKEGAIVNMETDLNLEGVSLAKLGITDDTVLDGGIVSMLADLSGKGNSPHQLVSSLSGDIIAEVERATIKNDAFEIIGSDIFLELLNALNPFMKDDETTELECAVVKFTAENGILTSDKQLAVETTKIKITGGGTIDMNTEEIEIGFSPISKTGIGVNAGTVVKFVRLGGTLSNPHPETDPLGLLKSGAAISAAISTGGLSLLADSLLKRAANAGSICEQALLDTDKEDNTQDTETQGNTDNLPNQ